MNRLLLSLATLVALVLTPSPAGAQANASIFPPASPEEVGMSSAALGAAMDSITRWVDERRIVGGILLVVRDGRLVFHEATGWNDIENGVRMQRDDILLMRSMTKPLTGTGIMMLVEDGRIGLDDEVHRWLRGFEHGPARAITVRQLLTHTSGMSGGLATGHATLLDAVAARGEQGPLFEPGTRYRYADVNSAALAAIIEVAAGMPSDRFLVERILEPLGMADSFFNDIPADDARYARVAAGYRGSSATGEWNRYRERTGASSLGFFGGSGGLYATGLDYMRFLEAMARGGELNGRRIVKPETVALMHEPHSHYVYTQSDRMAMSRLYGLHWYAWTDQHGVNPYPMSPGSFGHGGAEGTFAWYDPAERLMVLYLTQSNGNDTRPTVPRLVYSAILR
jgi:CubicO group peptidase (beta-lactamase class C family)